jgi:hypothetical protein
LGGEIFGSATLFEKEDEKVFLYGDAIAFLCIPVASWLGHQHLEQKEINTLSIRCHHEITVFLLTFSYN